MGGSSVMSPKLVEENAALIAGFMDSYIAFLSGNLTPANLLTTELDQIHPEDVEEMDISWQMAMAVFRAKNFVNKTGRNKWGENTDKKLGFSKANLRCYNCHEKGHFARECPKPRVDRNVAAGSETPTSATSSSDNSKALVVQESGGYSWSDQITSLGLNKSHAFMAEIDGPSSSEVHANLCSNSCIDKVASYRAHNSDLIREIENLTCANNKILKTEKAYKEKIDAQKKDIAQLQSDLSQQKCIYLDAKLKIKELTEELEQSKARYATADLTFKKFEVSSKNLDTLLDQQLHGKDKPGVGYVAVPPPFNDNYTSMPITDEEIELEAHMVYGAKFVPEGSADTCVNVSDVSTSCAEPISVTASVVTEEAAPVSSHFDLKSYDYFCPFETLNNDACLIDVNACLKPDICLPKPLNVSAAPFVPSVVANSKLKDKVVVCDENKINIKPSFQEKPPVVFSKTPSRRLTPVNMHSSNYVSNAKVFTRPVKRQICYNCGFAGHIARNCSHLPHGKSHPYPSTNQNSSKSMKMFSSKTKKNLHSKMRPSDGDWNMPKRGRYASEFRSNFRHFKQKTCKKSPTKKPNKPKSSPSSTKPKVTTPSVKTAIPKPAVKQIWKPKMLTTNSVKDPGFCDFRDSSAN